MRARETVFHLTVHHAGVVLIHQIAEVAHKAVLLVGDFAAADLALVLPRLKEVALLIQRRDSERIILMRSFLLTRKLE